MPTQTWGYDLKKQPMKSAREGIGERRRERKNLTCTETLGRVHRAPGWGILNRTVARGRQLQRGQRQNRGNERSNMLKIEKNTKEFYTTEERKIRKGEAQFDFRIADSYLHNNGEGEQKIHGTGNLTLERKHSRAINENLVAIKYPGGRIRSPRGPFPGNAAGSRRRNKAGQGEIMLANYSIKECNGGIKEVCGSWAEAAVGWCPLPRSRFM